MNSSNTLTLLATILQATRSQLNQISGLNQASEVAHGHDLNPTFFTKLFGITVTDTLKTLSLSANADRDDKLLDFLVNSTPYRLNWIEEVKATQWTDDSRSANVSHLFLQSESGGISGTVAYAVIAAHMTSQGFPVPSDMNARLYGAKKTVAKHRADMDAAERLRIGELKRQAGQ